MTRTIILTGARGGQGTSTVAATLAVLAAGHGPTLLRSDDPAATAALVGVPLALDDEWIDVCPNLTYVATSAPAAAGASYDTVVIDGGRAPVRPSDRQEPSGGPADPQDGVERYAVLRGPCYVALATLVTSGVAYDGVIVVTEPNRSLSERDVTDVLGIPVVATIPLDPAVARSIDAGIFVSRLHRHTASFRSLSRLAQPRNGLSKTPIPADTDLHLSLSDRSEAKAACRARLSFRAVWRAWKGGPRRAQHREAVAGGR